MRIQTEFDDLGDVERDESQMTLAEHARRETHARRALRAHELSQARARKAASFLTLIGRRELAAAFLAAIEE